MKTATLAGPVVRSELIAAMTLADTTVVRQNTNVWTVTSSVIPVALCICTNNTIFNWYLVTFSASTARCVLRVTFCRTKWKQMH